MPSFEPSPAQAGLRTLDLDPDLLTPKQREINTVLASKARHILVVGGGRSGKTFVVLRKIIDRALAAPGSRHAILRLRFNHVKASIWLDTLPKVAKICFPGLILVDHKADSYVEIPGYGSQIWFGGLDDKERVDKILGQEYATMYFNECSQIPYSSILVARTRLAQKVWCPEYNRYLPLKAVYDLNPTGSGHWTARSFLQHIDPVARTPLANPGAYANIFCNPEDNKENLPAETLEELANLPERQRRRFYEGVYQSEIDGALWTFDKIEHARCHPSDVPKDLIRVIVAVDPSGTKGGEESRSDEVGIIVAGKGADGRAYILDDLSGQMESRAWGRRAIEAYKHWNADCIVAEANYGGDIVEGLFKGIDANVPVHLVHASRGKAIRAEPVSVLYGDTDAEGNWRGDQIRHAGIFRELEDQMLNFSTAGYMGMRSPDRCDALVWALTDLMVEEMKGSGAFNFARREAAKIAREAEAAKPKPVEAEYAVGSVEHERQERGDTPAAFGSKEWLAARAASSPAPATPA